MGNTYLNSTIILNEALRILHNNNNFIANVNRQYDKSFVQYGSAGKPGTQLKVRLPNKYVVRTGLVANPQSTNEESITITAEDVAGVDMEFNDIELRMNINDFSKQHIAPAINVLSSYLEGQAFNMVKDIYNHVGTPGTTPSSMSTILDAKTKMNQFLAPKNVPRTLIVNSKMEASMVNAYNALFREGKALDNQYLNGVMGNAQGFNWFSNELVPVLTTGTRDNSTPVVNGASQSGASLICDGFNPVAGTIEKGAKFTLANVYAVHDETKTAYDFLKQFTVTAANTASGGDVTLAISPSIVTSGAKQNVDAGPADDAAITFTPAIASTNYPMNIAFQEDAFTFVTADLDLPKGLDMAERKSIDNINMRFLRGYDIVNAKYICRFDVLYGYKTLREELACVVWG